MFNKMKKDFWELTDIEVSKFGQDRLIELYTEFFGEDGDLYSWLIYMIDIKVFVFPEDEFRDIRATAHDEFRDRVNFVY